MIHGKSWDNRILVENGADVGGLELVQPVISAHTRAGLPNLSGGQKVIYEIEQGRRAGKPSAGNLSKAD